MMKHIKYLLSVFLVLSCIQLALADELAKKSQNPVGDVISIPLETWHHDGIADDGMANALIVKPVYPLNLGKLTLINRLIIPYIGIDYSHGNIYSDHSSASSHKTKTTGFGNTQYQGILTAASPGKIIWGLGPVLEVPTNTNGLGTDKWSGGASVLLLSMPGNWVVGTLLQNMWSFAGEDDDADVNRFTLQYFVNYNIKNGWYVTSTPIITADWNSPNGEKWTIPVGGGIGKLHKFGDLPIDFKLQAFANVEKPAGGPDWAGMFVVKFLFPK